MAYAYMHCNPGFETELSKTHAKNLKTLHDIRCSKQPKTRIRMSPRVIRMTLRNFLCITIILLYAQKSIRNQAIMPSERRSLLLLKNSSAYRIKVPHVFFKNTLKAVVILFFSLRSFRDITKEGFS